MGGAADAGLPAAGPGAHGEHLGEGADDGAQQAEPGQGRQARQQAGGQAVGYGFKKARENDSNIDEGARDVEENGVYVDEIYGKRLFSLSINSVLFDIEKLLDF